MTTNAKVSLKEGHNKENHETSNKLLLAKLETHLNEDDDDDYDDAIKTVMTTSVKVVIRS